MNIDFTRFLDSLKPQNIELLSIIESGYNMVFSHNPIEIEVYHGRLDTKTPPQFSLDYVGKGNDKYGPGFYFTTIPVEAWYNYAKGRGLLIKANIKITNPITLTTPNDINIITTLVSNSPGVNANPDIDWVAQLMENKFLVNSLNNVHENLYKKYDASADYAKRLISIGIDGIKVSDSIYIVFDPNNISVIDYWQY